MAVQPRRSRRLAWLAAGAVGLVVLGLVLTVVALLVRPAPAAAVTPATTAQTSAPASSPPAASPSPSPPRQEQQRYRAYVSTVATNGTALAGAMANLQDCRASRATCKQRIAEASRQVDEFQRALSSNPAPACLSEADQRLHDGLSFQGRGLALAEQAIDARNRVKMAQGLLLVAVGMWREGQGIRAARQSNC